MLFCTNIHFSGTQCSFVLIRWCTWHFFMYFIRYHLNGAQYDCVEDLYLHRLLYHFMLFLYCFLSSVHAVFYSLLACGVFFCPPGMCWRFISTVYYIISCYYSYCFLSSVHAVFYSLSLLALKGLVIPYMVYVSYTFVRSHPIGWEFKGDETWMDRAQFWLQQFEMACKIKFMDNFTS